jgi:multicomponent Na+:H+ antiporter subunit D
MLALLVPLTSLWRLDLSYPIVMLSILSSAAASVAALFSVLQNGTMHYFLGGWPPPLGIEYVVDEVSAFVAVVITIVATIIIMGTRQTVQREIGAKTGPFYGLVLLLLAGLTGIVVTGDLFNLFVFLEIASLAAYSLVFLGTRASMVAGFRYLILGSIGGAFYLLGVGFLYFATGSLNMADVSALLNENAYPRAVQAGAAFIFTGLGLKMALVPLHLWLPDAYTHSPSSVSSLIAPIMTKVSAYAMLRMFLSVFPDGYLDEAVPIATIVLILGLVGTVFGSVAAMAQHNFRRMLAYSSISQISLIAVGIGLASPLAFIAALLHIMNHAVMKAALFLVATNLGVAKGNPTIDDFSGVGRRMPITMIAFALGAISMIGIPPTAGFFSKWYLAQAGIAEGQWMVVVIILGSSLLTAVYMLRLLERAFFGSPQEDRSSINSVESTSERSNRALMEVAIPSMVLGLGAVALGLFNTAIVTQVLDRGT